MLILLFGVLNDEQRALAEQIFEKYNIRFRRIAFHIVGSEETAEDVVSDVFVKIMDNIEKISDLPRPQMTAFCVVMVKNASIDTLRRSKRTTQIDYWDNVPDEESGDIADEYIRNADIHRLTGLIQELEPAERTMIHLRYELEMGYKEIGDLLDISEEAAKKRGQRLVKKLKELYEKE